MSHGGGLDAFLESLRSLGAGAVALIKARVELFAVDFETELLRARNLALLKYALLLLALLAIGFTGCALIATFWDAHRVLVSWLVAGSFVVLSLVAWAVLVRARRAKPPPFVATLRQFEQDLAALRRQP